MSPLFSGQGLGGQWRKWILNSVRDAFNRPNTTTGLGVSDTGQPWSATRGNWFVSSNVAKSTDTATTYPLASIQTNIVSPYIRVDSDTNGGAGIAFWVTDAQNWYGLFTNTATVNSYTSYCSTYSSTNYFVCTTTNSTTTYYCVGGYSGGTVYCSSPGTGYDGFRGYYYATCNAWSQTPTTCPGGYAASTTYSCALGYTATSYSCTTYSSSSTTSAGQTNLRLIKSVANTVSTLIDLAISAIPASLQLFFNGNQIVGRAYSSTGQNTQIGADLVYTDVSPSKTSVHGLIIAPGGYSQGTTIDNFSASIV